MTGRLNPLSFPIRPRRHTTQDSTFDFEKRRNRPVKYDRELVGKTLQAMQKIKAIQQRREEVFYKNRMRAAKLKEKEALRVEIKDSIELLAPAAGSREKALVNVVAKARQRQAVRTSKRGASAAAGGAAGGEADDAMET